MTDKPTPTDAELNTILCAHWPAFAMQSTLVKIWVRDALQDAIDKWGQPAQKTVTVVPATGDVWLKHDDDLRYVRRVLDAGRQMTDVDQRAAIDIVQGLRVTARSMAVDAKKPAQAASSAVLKAIREANMQLVRTGDDAFMLVPYKAAKAQAAESVPAVDERAAFEAQFPVPGGVHWDGTEYVVKDSYVSSYRCDRFVGQWEAWKARAARATADSVTADKAAQAQAAKQQEQLI